MSIASLLLILIAVPSTCFRVKKRIRAPHVPPPAEFGFEYETKWLTCKSVPDETHPPKDICTYLKAQKHGLLGDSGPGVLLTSDTHYFGIKRDIEMSEMEFVGEPIPTVGGGEYFCGQLRSMSQIDKLLSKVLASGVTGEAQSWVVSLNVSMSPFVAVSLHDQLGECVASTDSASDTKLVVFGHYHKEASTSFFDFEEEEEGKWIFPSGLTGGTQVTFTVDFEKLTSFISDFFDFEDNSPRSMKQRLGPRNSASNWKAITVEIESGLNKLLTLGAKITALVSAGKKDKAPMLFEVNTLSIESNQQALTAFLSMIVYYLSMFDTKSFDRSPQYPKSSLSWLFRTNFANVARHLVLRDYFNSLLAFELFVYNVLKKLKDGKQYDPDVTDFMEEWLVEKIIDERTIAQHYKWCIADTECAEKETDARQISTTVHDYLAGLWGIDGEEITYLDLLSNRGLEKSSGIKTSIFESMGAFEHLSPVMQADTQAAVARGVTFELRAIGTNQKGESRPGEVNFITVPELKQLLHDYYAFLSRFNHGLVENLGDLGCE